MTTVTQQEQIPPQTEKTENRYFKTDLEWKNIIAFAFMHYWALYGYWGFIQGRATWKTVLFCYLYGYIPGLAICMGAHRLWAHRAYKATVPLRIFLITCFTLCMEGDIYSWVRDHRVHHKYSDTDADPHNSKRGFFFSHMGWLMLKKHPDVIAKGKTIDMSDIEADPVVRYHRKYYIVTAVFLGLVFPTWFVYYYCGQTLHEAWIATIVRYCTSLHITWMVNSVAHAFGNKPYDKNIQPVENKFVSYMTGGEGFHNYHHVFPWDYKASEFGNFNENTARVCIDFFAKMGWAYDLRTPSAEMIKDRMLRTGVMSAY